MRNSITKLLGLLMGFVLTLTLCGNAYAEVEFPFDLEGPGEYTIEIPEGDSWKVFNKESYQLLQLQFAEYKLELEKKDLIFKAELNFVKETVDLKIKNQNEIFQLKVNYYEDKIETLEERNKKLAKAASGTLLGIPKSTIWFAFGATAMALATK